jgi:hypothetical protein
LSYAKHENYGKAIAIFSIIPFSHGAFGLLTLPLNLITTISVAVSTQKSFRYDDKDYSLEKLNMFARFPQGIPPNIDISEITYLLSEN